MTTRAEIVAGLAEIFNEVADVEVDNVSEDKHLGEDLDLDSLAMAEVVVAAEERFGVRLHEEEMQEVRLVSEVVSRIAEQQAA
jgi:acyl carrier protein